MFKKVERYIIKSEEDLIEINLYIINQK